MWMTRLVAAAKPQVLRHYLALPQEDRHLRFGGAISDSSIERYVQRLDLNEDAVFGALDGEHNVVGVAHVPILANVAEVGVSILPSFRRRGIGTALVSRAADHARAAGVDLLFIYFAAENEAMLCIARSLGMDVVRSGSTAEAFLMLSAETRAHCVLTDL